MSTGAQQLSARLCFFTGGLLYFEINSCCFYYAYGRGHTGSRPVRVIGSLWYRHPEGAWKNSRQRPTAGSHSFQTRYAISLSYIDHLEIGGRRRPDSSSGCCHNSLRMSYRVVLDRISTDSHSSHTVVNVQVSCLSLWSLKLGNRYSCSHARVSKRRFSPSLQHFTYCKRATGCDVIHSMHTFA